MPLSNAQMRDVESILHPYTNLAKHRQTGPVIFERGEGVRVFDSHGKDYIEAMAGLWCTALGWGDNELAAVASEQMKKLSYGHLFAGRSHEPAIALAEKLKEISPFPAGKVFFANSGSEANDTQIKLFWYVNNALGKPQKQKIISRNKGYHGVTIASASLTGLANNHRSFNLPLPFVVFAEAPHHYRNALPGEGEEQFAERMAGDLQALIEKEGPDTIAAMIAEPLQGAGGVIIPPKGYFKAVTKVLAKYDIPLIDDEVITGFCRTGNWFGCETYGFQPDTMTLAKALSSAYLPISAVMISPEIAEIIEGESGKIGTFGHGFTYGGHPVSCAVALKTIELYEQRDVLGHVRKVAPRFQSRLAKLNEHPLVGETQGVGLIGGIQLVADKGKRTPFDVARAVALTVGQFCQDEGVIVRPLLADRIALCPPLVMSEAEIDEMFDRLEKGFAKGLDWVKREGLIS